MGKTSASRIALTLGLTCMLGSLSVQAQSQRLPTICQVRAYVIDSDPQGLNVRIAANSRSTVVGKLPLHTEVKVLASQNNWLLVSPVSPELQKVAFQGQGWVYASLLGLSTRGYDRKSVALYSQPSITSTVVGQVPSHSQVTMLACTGEWVLVKQAKVQGWLEPKQQCSATLTTCP